VPTANSDLFEMMGVARLPAIPLLMRMLTILLNILRSAFRSRAAVELENFALRHQLNVLKRSVKQRPKLMPTDRLLWVVLSRVWGDWRSALAIVQPETVIAYGPDTQSETGFRKAPRPIADKTALICGNYKGDSRGVTNWSLLAGMERWRTCA
jgi:hypothetical protein